ncbi:hypothetical protein, partial [Solihabitans fulvus]|uniref:hypothetical protein n=1 Tax=Solihabitans fulvus TaxID=1892852 RepID=UPI001CB75EC3
NYRELRAAHRDWQDGPIARFDECNWCYRNRYVDFDEVSYPLYGRHIVPLTIASCAGFTRRPSA